MTTMTKRGSSVVRVVLFAAAIITAGCTQDVGVAEEALGTIPEQCQIRGLGLLENADFTLGDMRGNAETGTGSWAHISSEEGFVQAFPDSVTCRMNGVGIGEAWGSALVDGATGYQYRLIVEDRRDPSDAGGEEVEGPPEVQTLTASRTYRPSRWYDDHLDVDGRAVVTIPATIPVTEGNAGKGWTWLTFMRDSFDVVKCKYRGGAPTPHPRTPAELSAGEQYVFDRCVGERPGTDPVEAGSRVEVYWMSLHVHTGSDRLPTCDDARTTVSVDLDVSPIVVIEPPRDRLLLVVFEEGTGVELFRRDADMLIGDLQVIDLD